MQAAMVCNSKAGLMARKPTVVFGAKAKQASAELSCYETYQSCLMSR